MKESSKSTAPAVSANSKLLGKKDRKAKQANVSDTGV